MSAASLLARVRGALTKLRWGTRVVGVLPASIGLFRLAGMYARRRPQAVVQLKSGPVLGFAFPRQLVPALVVFGDYIDPEFDFLRCVSKPDWIVLDVGAAIGQFSIFAATLPAARVYAFEPSGDNIATLEANIARNGAADRIIVKQMALSNIDAEMTFPTLSNPFLSRLDRTSAAVSGETVPVRTLAHALAEIGVPHVDCLKLNVAGFESEVIEGGLDFLAGQGADVLVILISESSVPWYVKIADLGYRFFFFHPRELRLYEINDLANTEDLDRPWPARHVIAVSETGISRGLLQDLQVVSN